MEFGGAKIQLALKIKDWLKEAFGLRLAGNYEQAEDTLQFAFRQFAQESETRWKEYQTATEYQERVRKNLQKIVKGKIVTGNDSGFNGRIRKTASGLSLLPLIDLVMDFDGPSVLEALTARGLTLCPELTEHLQQHKLRAGVIVRPGQSLNSEELVAKLDVKTDLTIKGRSSWPRRPATLAAFWPHNDAQRCHLLRTSEQHFGRSAAE